MKNKLSKSTSDFNCLHIADRAKKPRVISRGFLFTRISKRIRIDFELLSPLPRLPIPEGNPIRCIQRSEFVSAAPRVTPLPVGLKQRAKSREWIGRESGRKIPPIIVRVYTPYFILTLHEYILLVIIVPYFYYTLLVYILLLSDIFFQNISS